MIIFLQVRIGFCNGKESSLGEKRMQVKTRSSRAHTLGLKSDSTPYILEEKHIILPSYLVCIDRC